MKKIFSILLSFVMMLSAAASVQLCAYAEGNDAGITEDITEPANPVDPENPTDPVDPENPTDPVDPENPTDPVDPENPTDPVDPENPTDPVDPENPTDPVDPENPTDPVDPENPTDPVDPENPTDPVDPENPTDPVDPENPTDPVDPENPTDPVEPVKLAAPIVKLMVNDNGKFTLSWNEVEGADKYEIYVLNNTTGNYQLNGTVSKTSATTAVAPYGVKYCYKVRAIHSENEKLASDFSAVVTGVNNKKLTTPNLKVTENKNGTFTLSWNAVAGAEKYELCIRNADGSYKLMKTTTANSFVTAVAAFGKNYAYKMRAVTSKNVDAASAYSAVVGAVNRVALQTPSMKAAVNNNGTFTLSWGSVAGAEKYELYIKQANGSYKLMKTTTANSFTTAVAAFGKQYSYKMKAVRQNLSSAYSAAVSQKNSIRLQAPSLKVSVNANGTFTLSWNKMAGANKYELYIRQANGSYKLMKTTTANSFTTAVATYGKQYYYKAKSLSSRNSRLTSALGTAAGSVNKKKLTAPTGVKAVVNRNGSFTLSWNKVAGADKYELYIKQANGSYKLMKTTSANSFTTAVAKRGKAYSYKVRAVKNSNRSAASAYSAVVNAKRK